MGNQSIGSSAFSDYSEVVDFDLGSNSVHSNPSETDDSSYSDGESCAIQELIDHDLNDSSSLEEDELAHILQEQADISSSKRPPRGSSVIDYYDDTELNTMEIPSPPNVARIYFFQWEEEQGSPKRKWTTPSTISTKLKGSIIIHDAIEKKSVIWISFDIHTWGPNCDINQLSAVF